jgi:hypothetical protein
LKASKMGETYSWVRAVLPDSVNKVLNRQIAEIGQKSFSNFCPSTEKLKVKNIIQIRSFAREHLYG